MDYPQSSPISEIINRVNKTPLKDLNNTSFNSIKSPYVTSSLTSTFNSLVDKTNSRYSAYIPSSSSGSSELLQAKIEHLERERVDLSLKLHQKDEKDRNLRIKIDQLENQIKGNEQYKQQILDLLDSNKKEILKLKQQNKELQEKLSNKPNETENLWNRLTTVTKDLKQLEDEVYTLRKEKKQLESEKDIYLCKINRLEDENNNNESIMKDLKLNNEESKSIKLKYNKLLDDFSNLSKDNYNMNHQLNQQIILLQQSNDSLVNENNDLKQSNNNFNYKITEYESQIKVLNERQFESNSSNQLCDYMISDNNSDTDLLSIISSLKLRLIDTENKRKKLHNALQEMRGNIRVYVRCRPFLPSDNELDSNDTNGCVIYEKNSTSISLYNPNNKQSNHIFSFDHIFPSSSNQINIYDQVNDLVQSAIDGYKVCIFSYGQTGSGKTYTMTGSSNDQHRGIIPRAVEQVINQVMTLRHDGYEVLVTMSIIEIYNEDLRDLLVDSNNQQKLKISSVNGKVNVIGARSIELNTSDIISGTRHLDSLLEHASKVRTTASTSMNEHSSRSHVLYMIDITSSMNKNNAMSTVIKGGLRLVDLAGSERLDRTGTLNDNTRLKETVNINKSLSCLADVFIALSNKSPHVPYRNSKLTMILQDCLSGDGKALMFVNISPTVASYNETLCSLRFANQVNQVELGKAQKQIQTMQSNKQVKLLDNQIIDKDNSFDVNVDENINLSNHIKPNITSVPIIKMNETTRKRYSIYPTNNTSTSSNINSVIPNSFNMNSSSSLLLQRANTTTNYLINATTVSNKRNYSLSNEEMNNNKPMKRVRINNTTSMTNNYKPFTSNNTNIGQWK